MVERYTSAGERGESLAQPERLGRLGKNPSPSGATPNEDFLLQHFLSAQFEAQSKSQRAKEPKS
jgi:hypothetical protein